ncbi:NAD(P)/FAD-dependent oxidoreductase [Nitratireductor arenosus]|nr:FAD-binding oxidoreductase [Nitratireductor arenosus]
MSIYVDDVKFTPFWWEAAPLADEPRRALPKKADIVVVGSGYAGLCAALRLAESGVDVLVLEAEEPGRGASTRNGGAIGATLRYSLAVLIGKVGLSRALALYRGAVASREFVFDLTRRQGIDCGIVRCGRFYGAHKPGDLAGLQADLEQRAQHLGSEAIMVARKDQRAYIGSDAYFGGRFHPEDGHLHPGLYHRGLLAKVRSAGAAVIGKTRVCGVRPRPGGYLVETVHGTVAARQVIVATNAYTDRAFGWFRRRLIPIQSQIIATQELPAELLDEVIPNDYQIGDTCKLHNYYRRSPDRRRLLFGGRSGASQVNDFAKSGHSLHRRMTGIFPQLAETKVTHSWGGFIAFSFDHMPHIADKDGIHYIGGCCGSGVAMMSYLGDIAARKALGHAYDPTFEVPFKRQPFYTGDPWFMPAIIATLELRDRLRM